MTIEDGWDLYVRTVIPDGLDDIEIRGRRFAFEAGAACAAMLVLLDETRSTERAKRIQSECREYVDGLIEAEKS